METISVITGTEGILLAALGVVLLVVLFLSRMMFKLTATIFRLGCAIIFFLVAGVGVLLYVT